MPNRIIKESICTSEDIDSLTPQEEVFFYRLMVNCDDYGRFDARESILKARLFPLKNLQSNEINCYLSKLCSLKMIVLYENNGKSYIQMVNWEKHQQVRNHKSKYPDYKDEQSTEINCNQLKSNVTVIQSNPILSESLSESLSNPPITPFEQFYNAYPKKKAKGDAEKAFNKIKITDELLNTMLNAIKEQKKTADWIKDNGQYVPYPASWLNGKQWLDVVQVDNSQQPTEQLKKEMREIFGSDTDD